ncbi:MAG: substrate-binding domain-containing protein, partial [Lacipirellulaceae bacterium]
MRNNMRYLRSTLVLACLVISTFGCSGGSGEGGAQSKNIRIDGSSTVFPVSEKASEEYRKENPDIRISVSQSGTSAGFSKFVKGETDISDASRPIKDS